MQKPFEDHSLKTGGWNPWQMRKHEKTSNAPNLPRRRTGHNPERHGPGLLVMWVKTQLGRSALVSFFGSLKGFQAGM